MPTVHGAMQSPFVRKVLVTMSEKSIPYESNPLVPFGVSDEFAAISPLKKIPVYQDGDFTLPDSSCIIAYLERKHPSPALYPEDDEEFGRALFLEEYADTKLVENCGTIFFQRFVRPNFFKQDPDEALITKTLEEGIPPVLDYLQAALGDREWLAGGRFSIADIAVASPFVNFAHGGEQIDAGRWPSLAAYLGRVAARPSFKERLEAEQVSIAA